jgi:YidC/Oxa1 family membrane protein insertase
MSNWGPVLYLANLLQPVLAGIESFVHDWGIAVILLTLIVRVCLFPVSIRQARFGYRNRAFTKAYRDVQKTYKDDPDKLKDAAMKLTVEHKYNPFSMLGPMLLQMPIFAAVYAVFYHFGSDIHTVLLPWADALGQSDALHILPLLVGGINALGALVPMIAPDESVQASALAKFLPMLVIFPMMLFFLWKAPAAIGLYMAASSLWGIAERKFLRTPYAMDKFRLNTGLAKMNGNVGELRRVGETGELS